MKRKITSVNINLVHDVKRKKIYIHTCIFGCACRCNFLKMVRSSWLLQESESTGFFVTQRSSMSPERIVLKFTITGSLLYKQTRHCYAVLVLKLYCFLYANSTVADSPSSLDFYGSMQVHWTCNVMKIFSS